MVTTKEKSVVDTQKSLVKGSKSMTTKVDQISMEDRREEARNEVYKSLQKQPENNKTTVLNPYYLLINYYSIN